MKKIYCFRIGCNKFTFSVEIFSNLQKHSSGCAKNICEVISLLVIYIKNTLPRLPF